MKLLTRIRRALCRHAWQVSRFQALLGDGMTDCKCSKCHRYGRFYLRAKP